MTFSVLASIGVLLLAAVLLGIGMSPVLAVPVVLLAGGGLLLLWSAAGKMRNGRVASGSGPAGVPTTRDASYEPQRQP